MKSQSLPLVLSLVLCSCASQTTGDPRAFIDDVAAPVGGDEREQDAPAHPLGSMMRARQRLSADGRVPAGALGRALDQRRQSLESAPEAVEVSPTAWQWLGPGNIGGRIRSLLIHPTMHDTMWAGSASGGVWKTTDAGARWFPLDDYPASLAIGCMAMDPSDPDHLYVGTGEGGFFDTIEGTSNSAAILGAGIYESLDGGSTWNQMPSTTGVEFEAVNRIAIDPRNTAIIFAATRLGIYRSPDAGATWSRRTTEPALDLDIHPTDSSRMLAGRGEGASIYSVDAGLTWQLATGYVGDVHRTELGYALSNPDVVYAAVSIPNNPVISSLSIWRSDDGGQSFTRRTLAGDEINSLANYTTALFVDPTDEDRILFGGQTIRRSADQGVTHFSISGGTHSDHHVILPHPNFDGVTFNRVIGGNDGGVFFRDEPFISSTWFELNNNLGVTQFYGAAVHPFSGVVTGGTQDNGSMRFTGDPEDWVKVLGGDGGFCAVDPTFQDVFYVETQFLGIRRIVSGTNLTLVAEGIADTENFIPYYMLDPNQPGRMLAAARNLWRSEDVAFGNPPSWEIIKVTNCAENHFIGNDPCNISTIAVAEGNSDIIWVGHNNGEVYRTADGTAAAPTWTRVDLGAPGLPDRWVSRISIDPRDHDRVYISFMGYESDNVWRSMDGGQAWVDVTGAGAQSLPDIPVPGISVHPSVSGVLVAGTDLGVYWSLDDGATWTTSSAGPGMAAVEELLWRNDEELYVVTHGRGIYKARFALDAAVTEVVGSGCGVGGPLSLTATRPVVGTTLHFDLSGASPSAPGVLMVSPGAPVPLDLGLSCFLQVNPATVYTLRALVTDGAGASAIEIPVPDTADLIGTEFTTQVAVQVAGGPVFGIVELANGLRLRLGL